MTGLRPSAVKVVSSHLNCTRLLSSTRWALAADKSKYVPTSGSYPLGYKVGGLASGVKKDGQLDLAVIVSESECSAAAVFTKNVFQAAPVQVSKKVLESTQGLGIRSIIINSGCANAVTGEGGLEDARAMISAVDEAVQGESVDQSSSLVMSTGVIGQRLKMDKILTGIPTLVHDNVGSDHAAWLSCAKAICTTDTFPKLVSKEFSIGSQTYRVAGLAKGAGMIHPDMATLLGFFVTDAPVSQPALHKVLKHAVDRSFNSITVDGDTSTNDTIAALANGAAGGPVIDVSSPSLEVFERVITDFSEELAQLVVRDGEGATKFVTIVVEDALSYQDAKTVASSVATSSLVKTALYGKDANWGRILCATGYAGVPVEPFKTSVSFIPSDGTTELKLLVNGEPENVDEDRASEILALEDLEIRIQLGTGGGQGAKFWTCDLSHEYVTINGDYRS